MSVVDLTEIYLSKYIQEKNRDEYERSFPELFDHYYHFWARKEASLANITKLEIKKRKNWIDRLVESLIGQLKAMGINSQLINFVYMIGVGTTNGHAFKYENEFYVWLPLETYSSEELVKVFVIHEIAHALHYHFSPDFYFDSRDEQIQTSRQLISEGIATYFTKKVMKLPSLKALWADFLNKSDADCWWENCQAEEPNLLRLISEHYHDSPGDLELFMANDPNDIYKYRSGYYAGLKLVEQYALSEKLSVADLLKSPRVKFEKEILNLIKKGGE